MIPPRSIRSTTTRANSPNKVRRTCLCCCNLRSECFHCKELPPLVRLCRRYQPPLLIACFTCHKEASMSLEIFTSVVSLQWSFQNCTSIIRPDPISIRPDPISIRPDPISIRPHWIFPWQTQPTTNPANRNSTVLKGLLIQLCTVVGSSSASLTHVPFFVISCD
jgi:hypothetical protein